MGSRVQDWDSLPSDTNFNKEQLAELKECFVMFDRPGSGSISADDLGRALRALGQNPSNKDVSTILQQAKIKDPLDTESKYFALTQMPEFPTGHMAVVDLRASQLNFEQFVRAASSYGLKSDESMKEELTEAMKVFDRDDRGRIDVGELRTALKTFGESLRDEEIDDIIRLAGVKDDETNIEYAEFVEKVTAK